MGVTILLDESGDGGWLFDKPYRQGGSSRHLTIAAICVPDEQRHLPKRLIQRFCEKNGWPSNSELKWAHLGKAQRAEIATGFERLCSNHPEIQLHAIAVSKEYVQDHIRADTNKLYNYMVKTLLLDYMARHDQVTLVPDPRSIKVKSGNSMHDYLQTELWFTKHAKTELHTHPQDSRLNRGVQAADMLAGIVQSYFEDNQKQAFAVCAKRIALTRLFFPRRTRELAMAP